MNHIELKYYPGGALRALTMSYDDGNIADVRLLDIFDRYGIRGTFHLNSRRIGSEDHIAPAVVRRMADTHEVSCHSCSHPFLDDMPGELITNEMLEDKRQLEELSGKMVRGMSYPFGTYSDKVLQVIASIGLRYSRTVHATGGFSRPADFLTWHPTCHHNGITQAMIDTFEQINTWSALKLFYVWGHSFEFDRQDNWNLIESFCKRISGNSSTWYATNIELYDYLSALRRLSFTTDQSACYNDSAQTLVIGVNGRPVEISPGYHTLS